MEQYLEEFDIKIQDLKSVKCPQPLVFRPSRRYVSESLVELPVLVSRLDGREDVLIIQTYLIDAEVPFLCGKQTLESWKFKIDGVEKILEIEVKTDQKNSKKFLRMIDTAGGHYGIVLETQKKKMIDEALLVDDTGILFVEDAEDELCSIKAIKKVHEINHHRGRYQLISAYRNAGWMSLEVVNMIERVVIDCWICQKFQKSIARPRVSLPKTRSFNEVFTLD